MNRSSSNNGVAAAVFAYPGLDRVIHERARLGILISLMSHPKGLRFVDLRQLCGLTDGNLNRHLRVLERERLVVSVKSYQQHRQQTVCRITAAGRKRYLHYLVALERVLLDAAAAANSGRAAADRLPLPST